jgi:integrase
VFKIPEDISQVHRYIEELPRFQEFMTAKQRGSINGNIGYKTSLAYLQQFVTINYSGLNIDTIIDSGITDVYKFLGKFVEFIQTKKLAKSSVKKYLNDVKSYLQYHDIDIAPHKFKKRVILPKIPQEDSQPIDANDIRTILNQCHNRRLKAYLLVLASSGARPIEACAIRVCDINFDSSPVRLHIRADYTKTKKSRDIFISDESAQWLKDWIEYKFGITLNKTKKIDNQISTSLVFQVYNINIRSTTPQAIYKKLIQHFHKVLTEVNFDQRKEGMPRNRTISLHSFRRFAKTTISIQAGSDYSEWILGHKKSSYWIVKPETRAEIYSTRCMKYLMFLDYSTLEATGRSIEARNKSMETRISEFEKEKQIMEQKYEEQMNAMERRHDEQMNAMQLQVNRITEMIKYNPKLARLKQTALTRLAKK